MLSLHMVMVIWNIQMPSHPKQAGQAMAITIRTDIPTISFVLFTKEWFCTNFKSSISGENKFLKRTIYIADGTAITEAY